MTESKKQRMARELDARVRCLRPTGLDDAALFIAMSDRMDSFAARLPDLRHYAQLLTGIQDGTIKVPKQMPA